MIGRLAGDERIPRVERRIIRIEEKLAVKLVRAWLGQNLDAAVAQLVVLR